MTGESRVIERQIFIAASPETVFTFLVDPKLMSQWIGILHTLEPNSGGRFHVEVSPGNIARGTYVEVMPPRRVAFTWGWDSLDPKLALTPPGDSPVEIELEQKDRGTLLRLRHSGLPDATIPIHRGRWSIYLDRLQAVTRG